jgi:hypothetical protein
MSRNANEKLMLFFVPWRPDYLVKIIWNLIKDNDDDHDEGLMKRKMFRMLPFLLGFSSYFPLLANENDNCSDKISFRIND